MVSPPPFRKILYEPLAIYLCDIMNRGWSREGERGGTIRIICSSDSKEKNVVTNTEFHELHYIEDSVKTLVPRHAD